MDKDIIDKVRVSYGKCLQDPHFIDKFYDRFLASSPEIKPRFSNTDYAKQKQILGHAINMLVMFPKGNRIAVNVLERVRETHSSSQLNIRPELYQLWKRCLMETVRECDPTAATEILLAWDAILQLGIDFIVRGYKKKYQSAY
ncbi:MAG: globin [Gammaproteobacteria bacterium]|nr:globin [Gammaproteobacteria bacterium]